MDDAREKLAAMERELVEVPAAERPAWLVQRWANAINTHKRLSESLKGSADGLAELRAAVVRAEAKHAGHVEALEGAAAVVEWCRSQVGELFERKG